MIFRTLATALTLVFAGLTNAATTDSATTHFTPLTAFKFIRTLTLKPLELSRLAIEDEGRDFKGHPYRVADAIDLTITPSNAGRWLENADGRAWALKIDAADAVHLNFGFDQFELPQGAELRILSSDGTVQLGPYHQDNVPAHHQLWTPLILGSTAVLMLDVPRQATGPVKLRLSRIGQGYRGFGFENKAARSDSCNTDVACLGSSDPWNAPRRSVARLLIGGNGLCTGMLMNNTSGNRRLLLATASHCRITAANGASVVAYFNYENPTCRTPGSNASGVPIPPPSTTLQSSAWLASTSTPFNFASFPPSGPVTDRSDWTIIELNTSPSINSLNLHWAGWDRRATGAACSVPPNAASTTGLCASIHHPSGDEKRITFSETNLVTDNLITAVGAHWFVQWDLTPPLLPNIPAGAPSTLPASVTEPGSSGSPMFNAQRRVVGVLSGGDSFCGAQPQFINDLYGKLSNAYTGTLISGSATFASLLDPAGTGAITLNGIDGPTGDIMFSNGFEL